MSDKAKILICDDEEGVREALKSILKDTYQLAFAKNGYEALEHIKTQDTDLLLLDIKMPKLDGMHVLKELKKVKPEQKVIVITGYSSVATAYRAVKYGASDYIPKPFDHEHILAKIKKILQT